MLPVDNKKSPHTQRFFTAYCPALAPIPAPYPPLVVPAGRTWMVCAVKLPSEFDVPATITLVPTFNALTETIVGSDTGVEVE